MLYHILYKITNVVNQTYYIGVHSTNDLNDGYFGSGLRIKRSVKKYGKANHTFEVLEHLKTRESLLRREAEVVNENLLTDPLCLNLCKGGHGQNKGIKFSDETRKKISVAKSGLNNPNYGKPRSDEFKTTLSKKHKGRIITDDWKQNISEGMKNGKQKEYRAIVIDGVEYESFSAAEQSGIPRMTLWRRLKDVDKYKNIYYKDSPK